jgi:hypothetical protein
MEVQSETNIQPGMIADITHPAIYNPSTGINGITNARCFVERVNHNGHTRAQTLNLINIGATYEQGETVAPSWRISAVSLGVITIDAAHFSSDDRAKLKNGYRVTIIHKNGTIWEHGAVTYGARTMTNSPGNSTLSLSSPFSVTPSVGDMIVLADWGTPGTGFNESRHTFMSDVDGAIGNRWGF